MTAKIKTAGPKKIHARSHRPKRVSQREFEKVYWPYLPVLLIVVFLLSISVQSGALGATLKNPVGRVMNYATGVSINQLLASTNSERVGENLSALKLDTKLNASAQAKAEDMAKRNYWSHDTPDGEAPWIFVTAEGYQYQKLGENLAAGFADAQSAVAGWMGSPGHRANILDPAFSEVGFGFANNPDYTSAGGGPMTIIVAHYGKPTVLAANTVSGQPATPDQPAQEVTSQPQSRAKEPKPEAIKKSEIPKQAETAINTDSSETEIVAASTIKASRAQLALGSMIDFSLINGFMALLMLGIVGLWASRHLLAIRRVVIKSETIALRHPLLDIGLLVILALCFLLSQTIGLLQ